MGRLGEGGVREMALGGCGYINGPVVGRPSGRPATWALVVYTCRQEKKVYSRNGVRRVAHVSSCFRLSIGDDGGARSAWHLATTACHVRPSLLDSGQDVGVSEQEILVLLDGDWDASVLRNHHLVAGRHRRLDQLAVLRGEARADGHHGGQVVLWLVLLWDVDSGRRFLRNGDSLDEDTVQRRDDRLG